MNRLPTLHKHFLLILIFCFGPLLLTAQDKKAARQELRQIRSEISKLQSDLKRSESSLRSSLADMENLDKQTTLQQQALRVLGDEIKQNQSAIGKLNTEIDTLNSQVAALKEIFKKQMVFSYKHMRGSELQWLLGSENFNQALVRYRYFQTISGSAKNVYDRLQEKHEKLSGLKDRRSNELQQQKQLAGEKEKEQTTLKAQISQRQTYIRRIKQNKNLLEKALNEKNASLQRLQNIIGDLASGRDQRSFTPQQQIEWDKIKGNFARQKKKLNWPIQGKIVHKFGKYRNPKLKTVQVNNGIDIRAEKGTAVRCVFSGAVSVITYMSGYGNTIILDHDNGYYTVYAHLDEIFVKKFDVLDPGTILGTVGDSGSLEGAMLHFEIYGNNKAQNPISWLKKR